MLRSDWLPSKGAHTTTKLNSFVCVIKFKVIVYFHLDLEFSNVLG